MIPILFMCSGSKRKRHCNNNKLPKEVETVRRSSGSCRGTGTARTWRMIYFRRQPRGGLPPPLFMAAPASSGAPLPHTHTVNACLCEFPAGACTISSGRVQLQLPSVPLMPLMPLHSAASQFDSSRGPGAESAPGFDRRSREISAASGHLRQSNLLLK